MIKKGNLKALALFSGGLDSQLAIALMHKSGIEVEALHFDIGFGGREDVSEVLKARALAAGASSFLVVDVKNKYLQKVLFSPKYGYGKAFNPCIDCHAFMFKCALEMLHERQASFVISGEVLGQRPMSQRMDALIKVKGLAKDEEDLILRPLSAKLLAPCKPVLKNWVDQECLLDISGRSRQRQFALAEKLNLKDFASPGGGCLLTLQNFASRIKDLLKYEKNPSVCDLQLLKWGRHLRLENGSKMIIGRNEEENLKLLNLFDENYLSFDLLGLPGAFSLLHASYKEEDLDLALSLALAYSKAALDKEAKIAFKGKEYKVKPALKDLAKKYLIT